MNVQHILKQAFIVLGTILLTACGPDKKHARLEGKFKNIDNAEFYIYQAGDAFTGIDTIRIDGGKFTYETPLSSPAIFTLQYPNFSHTLLILEPGKTVKIAADAEHLAEIEISGTEENTQFTDLRLKIEKEKGKNKYLAAAQFIHDHATSLDGLAAYLLYFDEDDTPSAAEKLALLQALRKGMPQHEMLTQLYRLRESYLRNGKGQKLEDFDAITLTGRSIRLTDYKGKPLLISFVASWQPDSRAILYTLQNLQSAHPAAFHSLVIVLDAEREKAMEMLQNGHILQEQAVLETELFDAPLAIKLGIDRVPGNILINAQGTVVARNLSPDRLKNEVGKLTQ